MNLLPQATQPTDLGYRIIPLTQGKVAIVDERDFADLFPFRWYARRDPKNGKFYAVRNEYGRAAKKQTTIQMHRQILEAPRGLHVDHHNGDSLDNRRFNIRLATPSQNQQNRLATVRNASGFKGVSYRKRDKKWAATIQANREWHSLGYFSTAEAAAEAYQKAAANLHGEFANW